MTTNQTIDGVQRELLADILHQLETKAVSFVTVGKLRALLDAPSVEFSSEGWDIDHSAGRPILVHNNCSVIEAEQAYGLLELIKTAAQPQGEPLSFETWFRREIGDPCETNCKGIESRDVYVARKAWDFKDLPDFNDLTQDLRHRSDLEGREFRVTVELVAEQPAPVAVVMPDRMEPRDEWDMESHQWNACLDELRRLNP